MPDINYLVRDTEFVEKAKAFLPDQFHTKENIIALLEYLISAEQDFERLIVELAQRFVLDAATGAYLDSLAAEVGIERDFRTDEELRSAIKTASKLTFYRGTYSDTLALLVGYTGDSQLRVEPLGSPWGLSIIVNEANIANKTVEDFIDYVPVSWHIRLVAYSEDISTLFRFGSSVWDDGSIFGTLVGTEDYS